MAGMSDAPLLYRLLNAVLPPVVNPYLRLRVEGLERVPERGGAILACNHLSFLDSVVLPLNLPRPVYFLGKAEYFESWRTRWFFRAAGVVPVHREGGSRAEESLEEGAELVAGGDLLGVYPEGTRSPDGRLYRGKTGPVRIALRAGAPIIPCAVVGTDRAMPIASRLPRRFPVTVRYGRPLDLSAYEAGGEQPAVLRAATDELMYQILSLSAQEYVDEYAGKVKRGEVEASELPVRDDPRDDPGMRHRRAS